MLFKIKRLSKFYKYLFISFGFVLILFLFFVSIIYYFPIKTTTTSLSTAHFSQFVTPWPFSALDKEYQDRKRLRRYAKSEQKKRIEKQLQRMNILSVPIYDLSLDDEAEILVNDPNYYADKIDLLWPILPTNRVYHNTVNPSITRRSVNLLLPNRNWTSLFEGVYLAAGDEIKSNIPIIKDRRYLSFLVFPLTPGNMRVILGQYVWTKTFGEEEVHKIQKINIPINDPTATNIRIVSISCSTYLEDMSINQNLRNGREPIKVAIGSPLWQPNKKFLMNQSNAQNENDETELDNALDPNDNLDDNSDDLPAETKAVAAPEPVVKETVREKDPLLETANSQLLVNNEYSTAFGYNIVVIQTPPISSKTLTNSKLLKKIAPNIFGLMDQSVFFENNIQTMKEASDTFRQTIFQNYLDLYDFNPKVFQYKIEHNETENTYQKFRRYGYKVVSITLPETLFFTKNLTWDNQFYNFYNRWLDTKDWEFENRNVKIDDKSGTSSGLDVIFNLNNSKKIQPPLSTKDYTLVSNYLSKVAQNVNSAPNWHPNEYMLVSNQHYYAAKVVDAFQNWAESYEQSRFFAHILLDSQNKEDRPNLTNLKKSLLSGGSLSLLRPKYVKSLSELSHLDAAIGDILNILKAKRIENRTLVFVLIPDENKKLLSSGIYKIPGLVGKKFQESNIALKDVISTLFSNVGIPTGINLKNPSSNLDGNMLEVKRNASLNAPESIPHFLKYTMLIQANKNHCSPIIWKSNNSNIFGVQSDFPIYRIIDSNTLEIYPCSLPNKLTQFSWYQNKNPIENALTNGNDKTIEQIGGYFNYFKTKKDFPEVFFGKNLISYNNIVFLFKSLNETESQNIFYVPEIELSKTIQMTQESFSSYDSISSEKNSKLALFITPL